MYPVRLTVKDGSFELVNKQPVCRDGLLWLSARSSQGLSTELCTESGDNFLPSKSTRNTVLLCKNNRVGRFFMEVRAGIAEGGRNPAGKEAGIRTVLFQAAASEF